MKQSYEQPSGSQHYELSHLKDDLNSSIFLKQDIWKVESRHTHAYISQKNKKKNQTNS